MPEHSDLDRRLRAVERALTDGNHDIAELQDSAAMAERLDGLEDRIATLEEQTAELDAATQAVRGYVGNVRAVNEDVEERADAALAAVDRIEARLDDTGSRLGGTGQRRNDTESRPDGPESKRSATGPRPDGPARSPEPSGERHSSSRDRAAGERARTTGNGRTRPGIEMPSPAATATEDPIGEATDEDQEADRSVIERVREAL